MRLVFAGTPEVALPSLETLAASGHEVVAVVTRPDAARGRSRRLHPSAVGAWAADHGLPVLKPATPRDPAFVAELASLAPDACPVVAYGALVPQQVLDLPQYGWINLHFSLLPRWRGAAPVQRAILAGDSETGATTFRLVRELDAGPVYATLRRPLAGTETAGEVLDDLAARGARLLLETLDALPGSEPTPQPEEGVTLAPKLTTADARIDWSRPADEVDRLVRGCAPEPGAWTTLAGERVRVGLVRAVDGAALPPGELLLERRRVLAGTGTTPVSLERVQPAGRAIMAGADWGRGLRGDGLRFD